MTGTNNIFYIAMFYVVAFIVLVIAELVYFKLADRLNIIDKPNERSSHNRVTLRGGGIVFYFGVLLLFLFSAFIYPYFFTGLTLITAISFADDIKPRSAKFRLAIHFLSMFLMFYQLGLFEMPWYVTLFALILCTGILNAWNFMDGINGITGGYSLIVMVSFWYINTFKVTFVDNELIYIMLIALMVFNFYNFRKRAKCFAGDVGAISIAFTIVFLLGLLVIETDDFSYLILLSVYGIDSILTVMHRLMRHENIFEAHRKHAYQLLANELQVPHVWVAGMYMFLQALVTTGFLVAHPYFHWYYIAAVLVLLGVSYIMLMKKFFHLHVATVKDNRN